MFSAAPSCLRAASSAKKQVAVTLALPPAAWHKAAEKEKFPSPTSNTSRGAVIVSLPANTITVEKKRTFKKYFKEVLQNVGNPKENIDQAVLYAMHATFPHGHKRK